MQRRDGLARVIMEEIRIRNHPILNENLCPLESGSDLPFLLGRGEQVNFIYFHLVVLETEPTKYLSAPHFIYFLLSIFSPLFSCYLKLFDLCGSNSADNKNNYPRVLPK